jgi:cell division protein FtsL
VVQNAAAEPEVPQPSPKEDTRHLRVVPPRTLSPAQRRRRARALLLAAAGLVAVVAFGLVYLHVVLAQRQFALDQLTQKVQTDRSTYERLRVQVAQLGSPANIISRAEGKLGMRQPASVTYLTPPVTIGGPVATATPARPATGQVEAPAGIADWPQIKAQLAGSP